MRWQRSASASQDAHAAVAVDGRRMVELSQKTWPQMRTSGAVEVSELFGQHRSRFRLLQGGQCPLRGRRRGRRVRTAAEIVLDGWVQEDFNALGKRPSEAIQKICEGEQRPLSIFARRIIEAHAAGVEHDRVRRIGLRLIEWIDRLYGADSDGETVTERVFFQSPLRVA